MVLLRLRVSSIRTAQLPPHLTENTFTDHPVGAAAPSGAPDGFPDCRTSYTTIHLFQT
jgi:hypothetical protein